MQPNIGLYRPVGLNIGWLAVSLNGHLRRREISEPLIIKRGLNDTLIITFRVWTNQHSHTEINYSPDMFQCAVFTVDRSTHRPPSPTFGTPPSSFPHTHKQTHTVITVNNVALTSGRVFVQLRCFNRQMIRALIVGAGTKARVRLLILVMNLHSEAGGWGEDNAE